MIRVFPSLESISAPFKGVLLDAYGVFWSGNKTGPFPGSVEAMERLVSSGKMVGILSNSTQLAQKEIEKLKAHGLLEGKHFHFFLTSGEIAKRVFAEQKLPFPIRRKKFYVFGESHPRFSPHALLFQESCYEETQNVSEADFIYLAIPHIQGEDQLDPKVFWQDLRLIKEAQIPMVCANPDRFAHEGAPPRAVVRQGSLASYFEEIGGEVFYIGKPSSLGYEKAMEFFKRNCICQTEEVLMVGDTPEIDIRGARKVNMKSALVLQTGIMAERLLKNPQLIQTLDPQDTPDFFIERLASV